MNFQETEAKYRELRSKLVAGEVTDEEFREGLKSLMVKDDQGRFWNVGAETGKWYYFDEGQWVEGTPPRLADAPPVTPAWEEPGEAETVLIASAAEEAGEPEAVPAASLAEEPDEAETVLIASAAEEAGEPEAVPTPSAAEEAGEPEAVLAASSVDRPGAAETVIGAPLLSRLVVASGSRQGEKFTLSGEVRLGREEDNDIVLYDPKVSRHHAAFRPEAGGYIVVDLGSANGTFVNGQQIAAPQFLAEGDTIVIGDTEMTYRAGLAVEEPLPTAAPPLETYVPLAAEPLPAFEPTAGEPLPLYESLATMDSAPLEAVPAEKKGLSTCLVIIIVLAILLCCAVVVVGGLAMQGGLLENLTLP